MKKRLDQLVFEQGLAPTLAMAQAMILAGEVRVNGTSQTKAGFSIPADAEITIHSNRSKFVSRGGEKLSGALDHFNVDVSNRVCLDVGASTGGFTDCLLQRGAARVYTIDVGKAQLDERIRTNPRVSWKEEFHARDLKVDLFPEPIALATVDVSFISLRRVLPSVVACIRPGGFLLALIKPQFEAKRGKAPRGVVRDEDQRARIVTEMSEYARSELHLTGIETADSVLAGPKGNREVFLFGEVPTSE